MLTIPEAGDRRRRERRAWSLRQRVKNFVIAAVVRAAFVVTDRLPATALLALGRGVGRLAWLVLGTERATAIAQVERVVHGPNPEPLARESFVRAGENLAACLLLRRPETSPFDWVSVPDDSIAALRRALAPGRGAVFVSAHLGPFEHVLAVIGALGIPASVVVRESYDPRLDPWVDAHRIARGVTVIHRGARGAGVKIVRALRAGQPVGLLPDLGARVPSFRARFMGTDSAFPSGPARLVKRTGAALIVGTLERRRPAGDAAREGHGERGRRPPFTLRIVALDVSGSLERITQCVASELERAVLCSPADWLWMARRRASIADDGSKPVESSAALEDPYEGAASNRHRVEA